MTRTRTAYRCAECGASAPRWSGRCPACSEWNTLAEERRPSGLAGTAPGGWVLGAGPGGWPGRAGAAGTGPGGVAAAGDAPAWLWDAPEVSGPVGLDDVDALGGRPRPTGVAELDRVLGGGLVPGSVTVVGGEPGIGKSTLLLQALGRVAEGGARTLLVSAEESPQQVKRRAERLGVGAGGLWIVGETSLPGIRAAIDRVRPEVVVVDSIQTVWDPDFDSAPGSVSQVRGCAHALVALTKSSGLTTVLVGHVTKDGTLAGPRVLEHVVDTVLSFEGDRHHALRLLRATKHRFGATGELGVFEMTDAGLEGVADASGMFLADRRPDTAGSAVFASVEGQRPLLVEIQSLVVGDQPGPPRRHAAGLDGARLSLLIAVLFERARVGVQAFDVYASVAGGARVSEPGADLAVCLALASAAFGRPLPGGLVAVGEVGLGGELRAVGHMPRRLAESARLGFSQALIPAGAGGQGAGGGMDILPAATVGEAIALALGQGGVPAK